MHIALLLDEISKQSTLDSTIAKAIIDRYGNNTIHVRYSRLWFWYWIRFFLNKILDHDVYTTKISYVPDFLIDGHELQPCIIVCGTSEWTKEKFRCLTNFSESPIPIDRVIWELDMAHALNIKNKQLAISMLGTEVKTPGRAGQLSLTDHIASDDAIA